LFTLSLLNQAKYLLSLEVVLLVLFIIIEPLPFFLIISIILAIYLFYYSFEAPFFLLNLLIFSILLGSLGLFKVSGKSPPVLVLDLVFVLVFFILFFKSIFHFNEFERFSLFSLFWIPFLIWGSLSLVIAYDKFRALLIWRSYFAGFISFSFAFFVIQKRSHVSFLIVALIIWGLILAIIEFYILMQLGGLSSGIVGIFFKKNLLATTWGKSNYLATFFVLIIPIAIGYFLTQTSRKAKLFSGFSLLFMFSALIFTLSRGGILALMIALGFLLFGVVRPRTMIPILIAFIAIALIVVLNPLTSVIIERLSTVERSFSYMTRVNFYSDVWKMILNNPIVGVGLGNLGYHAQFKLVTHSSAHNIFLGLLGETGIIGAVLFFILFGKVVSKYIKDYITESNEHIKILRWAFISSLLGSFVHSLMEPNFEGYQFSIMFWLTVALYFKLNLLSKNIGATLKSKINPNDAYR
jgi:O-antigen ligase